MRKLYLLLMGIFLMLFGIFAAVMYLATASDLFAVLAIAAPIAAIVIVVIAFLPKKVKEDKENPAIHEEEKH